MSSKTKTGGWFLDDESAGIGYNPYPKVKRLTEPFNIFSDFI
ncbi:unnamed protein product [marine sediment metagenome]|uniref:Uncharacterized protein n=1 Tax=marine sediment metagenome TaxID=412755 RepID=X1C1M2_9ZZZZ